MRVLITCGPTWVKIDDVRVISNHSSGEMGHLIAEHCIRLGLKVTLLEGEVTHPWQASGLRRIKFRFLDEFEKLLALELKKNYDCVIHAAAVSDFVPAKALKGKIDSSKPLTLKLVRTPKLIERIKKISPDTFLVGFKLEPALKPADLVRETRALFVDAGCDLVLANSVSKGYKGFIVDADGNLLAQAQTKKNIAHALINILYGRSVIGR